MGEEEMLTKIIMDDSLISYEKFLKELAVSNKSDIVANKGLEHAALLLKTIFNTAQSNVDIFCGTLRSDLSRTEDYYNSLKDCIERGVKVRVIFTGENTQMVPEMIRTLFDSHRENVETKHIHFDALTTHFTIADDRIFRMEYDIDNFKAYASFNDKEYTSTLAEIFNRAWAQ